MKTIDIVGVVVLICLIIGIIYGIILSRRTEKR